MPSSSREQRDRLVVDRLVLLAAVAVLHDRHAGALEVEQLVAGALERGEREAGGAGVEVDGAHARPSTPRRCRGRSTVHHGATTSVGIPGREPRRVHRRGRRRPGVPEALRAGGARVRRLLRLGGHAADGPEDLRDGPRLRRLALPRQASGGADPEPADPALQRALRLGRAAQRCSRRWPGQAHATSTPTGARW